ncbi:MAG: response regulator [bacterium]
MSDGSILVVDDEKNIRRTLALVLEGEGFTVTDAGTAEEALDLLERRRFDMLLLDVCLPGMDGITALKLIHEQDADLPVVMISGHASVRDAVEATRAGAFDFIEKPLGRERVLVTVRNALLARSRTNELQALRAVARPQASGLLGASPVMERLREQIAKVAPTRARILITGESGTGKELVARASTSSRTASRPFVKVNCAAIPNDLLSSRRCSATRRGPSRARWGGGGATSSWPTRARSSSTSRR